MWPQRSDPRGADLAQANQTGTCSWPSRQNCCRNVFTKSHNLPVHYNDCTGLVYLQRKHHLRFASDASARISAGVGEAARLPYPLPTQPQATGSKQGVPGGAKVLNQPPQLPTKPRNRSGDVIDSPEIVHGRRTADGVRPHLAEALDKPQLLPLHSTQLFHEHIVTNPTKQQGLPLRMAHDCHSKHVP